jgi:hypothetical protein
VEASSLEADERLSKGETLVVMGVIKKKTVTRSTEGGVKYVCDVCSADITSTVSTPFQAVWL